MLKSIQKQDSIQLELVDLSSYFCHPIDTNHLTALQINWFYAWVPFE